jgi:hypothetical protein
MEMQNNGVKNFDSRSKCSLRTSIEKNLIEPCRIRKIKGSFAFIEHRFLWEGFWASLNHHQLLLYLFLIIVSDRNGLSYYSYDKICTLLGIVVDEYILARNALIDLDLIAFDGSLFQVLSLPDKTGLPSPAALNNKKQMEQHDPATIHHLVMQSFGRNHDRNCQ